ncbi:MAG: hypothetical protein H0W71_08190 [Sphingomonas sp.]|nr:hypothetical protein [Sphingomonas sp.]
MHIHVPKPIHGWKQFFNEVAVISIGIGIALGGEELVSSWNAHHYADKSLMAIKDEVAINLGRMQARMTTADCIDRRLDEIAKYIEKPDELKKPTWVGRPQVWALQNSAVTAARSYGSMTLLPRDEQMTISTIYSTMDQFADVEKDEQWAWAELRSIAEDRDITDTDKASLRQAIQRARYAAWLLRISADQSMGEAKPLHVVPIKQVGSTSVCIPMHTPFDVAVKQSGKIALEPR